MWMMNDKRRMMKMNDGSWQDIPGLKIFQRRAETPTLRSSRCKGVDSIYKESSGASTTSSSISYWPLSIQRRALLLLLYWGVVTVCRIIAKKWRQVNIAATPTAFTILHHRFLGFRHTRMTSKHRFRSDLTMVIFLLAPREIISMTTQNP